MESILVDSPSFSSSGSLSTDPVIYSCRWAWCRAIFYSNSELIHHVIQEHIRQSVAVPRRDIPMLRKAEEGIGESMSSTGMTVSNIVGSQSVHKNYVTEAVNRPLTPACIPIAQHQLSQSSPTVESPACPHATSETASQDVLDRHPFDSVVTETSPRNAEHDDDEQYPSTLISQALPKPSIPKSQRISHPNPQGFYSSSVLEITPQTTGPFSPKNATSSQAFSSFASLTSPSGFVPIPSLPSSPSFQSQVSDGFRMGGAGGECDLGPLDLVIRNAVWSGASYPLFSNDMPNSAPTEQNDTSQLSQVSPSLQLSTGSCDREKQEPSQNPDTDVNHDNDVDTSGNISCSLQDKSFFGIGSDSEQNLSIPSYFPPEHGQVDADTQGSHISSSMHLISQRPFPSQQQSQFQSQYPSQPRSQTHSLTESSSASPPLALLTQAQRQTWYQVSSPYSIRLDSGRKHPKSPNSPYLESVLLSGSSIDNLADVQSGSRIVKHSLSSPFRSGSLGISRSRRTPLTSNDSSR